MFISHYHNQEDGYGDIPEASPSMPNDNRPTSSIVRHPGNPFPGEALHSSVFTPQDMKLLADMSEQVTINAENIAYLHNLVVFLRRNRFVAKGVSPVATTHLKILSQYDQPSNDYQS